MLSQLFKNASHSDVTTSSLTTDPDQSVASGATEFTAPKSALPSGINQPIRANTCDSSIKQPTSFFVGSLDAYESLQTSLVSSNSCFIASLPHAVSHFTGEQTDHESNYDESDHESAYLDDKEVININHLGSVDHGEFSFDDVFTSDSPSTLKELAVIKEKAARRYPDSSTTSPRTDSCTSFCTTPTPSHYVIKSGTYAEKKPSHHTITSTNHYAAQTPAFISISAPK